MQPRPSQVHEFLMSYSGAVDPNNGSSFMRSVLRLELEGGESLTARLRDIRGGCCLIDVEQSVFTLAYADVLEIDGIEPGSGATPTLRLRSGSLAMDANGRLARASRRPRPSEEERSPRRKKQEAEEEALQGRRKREPGAPLQSLEEVERMLRDMK